MFLLHLACMIGLLQRYMATKLHVLGRQRRVVLCLTQKVNIYPIRHFGSSNPLPDHNHVRSCSIDIISDHTKTVTSSTTVGSSHSLTNESGNVRESDGETGGSGKSVALSVSPVAMFPACVSISASRIGNLAINVTSLFCMT